MLAISHEIVTTSAILRDRQWVSNPLLMTATPLERHVRNECRNKGTERRSAGTQEGTSRDENVDRRVFTNLCASATPIFRLSFHEDKKKKVPIRTMEICVRINKPLVAKIKSPMEQEPSHVFRWLIYHLDLSQVRSRCSWSKPCNIEIHKKVNIRKVAKTLRSAPAQKTPGTELQTRRALAEVSSWIASNTSRSCFSNSTPIAFLASGLFSVNTATPAAAAADTANNNQHDRKQHLHESLYKLCLSVDDGCFKSSVAIYEQTAHVFPSLSADPYLPSSAPERWRNDTCSSVVASTNNDRLKLLKLVPVHDPRQEEDALLTLLAPCLSSVAISSPLSLQFSPGEPSSLSLSRPWSRPPRRW